jgi:hypothetical protein
MADPAASNPHAGALLSGALATLGLTAAHHAYGAVRYDTPWRLHGALVAVGIGLVLAAAASAYRRHPDTPLGRFAGWTQAIIVLVFPVLVIGALGTEPRRGWRRPPAATSAVRAPGWRRGSSP